MEIFRILNGDWMIYNLDKFYCEELTDEQREIVDKKVLSVWCDPKLSDDMIIYIAKRLNEKASHDDTNTHKRYREYMETVKVKND